MSELFSHFFFFFSFDKYSGAYENQEKQKKGATRKHQKKSSAQGDKSAEGMRPGLVGMRVSFIVSSFCFC
jgi:hypothetical protein